MVAERVIGKMTNDTLKLVWPYSGIPIVGISLLLTYAGKTDAFLLLQMVLISVFGYVATVTDITSKRIPNTLILAMLGTWVLTFVPKLFFDVEQAVVLLIDAALGFGVGGGLFLLVYIISRSGLGGGDVKFMAATGLYVGVFGIIAVMLYGMLLVALTGLILLLLKKMGRKDTMPLAPFLYVGILITVFYG